MDAAVDYVTNVLGRCVCFVPIPPGKTHTPSMGIHIQRHSLLTITATSHMGFWRRGAPIQLPTSSFNWLTFQRRLPIAGSSLTPEESVTVCPYFCQTSVRVTLVLWGNSAGNWSVNYCYLSSILYICISLCSLFCTTRWSVWKYNINVCISTRG